MSRKFGIVPIIFCSFITVQSVCAADQVIPDEPLLGVQINKDPKLMGNLPQLRDDSVTRQNAIGEQGSTPILQDDFVAVDAIAAGDVKALESKLRALGMQNITVYKRTISGKMPIGKLKDASSLKELQFMRPVHAMTNGGLVTSQADVAMNSDDLRLWQGIDGSGVTIGTLSDSYNCIGGAATDVGTGDLPAGVTVLDEGPCPASDEGRAMMQLIHDVAPGSSQSFHTAFQGQADFAQGILDLAAAGADVIVDDVTYATEPFFQDGIIAQAVDTVVAQGVSYFSSAGNSARDSYESEFRSSGVSLLWVGGDAHDFDPGPGTDILQAVQVPIGSTVRISFQWDQPFFSVSGAPGGTTDMDICIVNAAGTAALACATSLNIGNDPVEFLAYTNTTASPNLNIAIEKYSPAGGPDPELIKFVGIRNIDIIEYDTNSSTIFGHHNAAGANSVGAAFYQNTPEFGVNPPTREAFSSAGGTPILFDNLGFPIGPVNRNKPDFVAPDGTNNTFFGGSDPEIDGFPNFFGTSAAAPHAAAVAALMLEADASLTPMTINSLLESTAIDMDVPGFDDNTGHGLINAVAALSPLIPVVGEPTNISGLGCPNAGTISSDLSVPGTATLAFTQHDVGEGADSGIDWKSACNFNLAISIPPGKSLDNISFAWSGTSEYDTTIFRRKYLVDGVETGPWKKKKFNFGPVTPFTVNDNVAVNSGCGGETLNLRVKTKTVAVYASSYLDINDLVASSVALSDCVDP